MLTLTDTRKVALSSACPQRNHAGKRKVSKRTETYFYSILAQTGICTTPCYKF